MRFALRLLLPALVLLGPMQGRASAVTIQELLEFKGKLSDDVLVALIESDGSVFHLSIGDVAALKDKGLSEKVILAMLKTATKQQTTPAPPPMVPQPQPVYAPPPADPYGQPPQYAQEPPPPVIYDPQDQGQPTAKAPVVVNVRQDVTQHVDQPQQNTQPYYAGYPLGYYQYRRIHRRADRQPPGRGAGLLGLGRTAASRQLAADARTAPAESGDLTDEPGGVADEPAVHDAHDDERRARRWRRAVVPGCS